ncbi:MAG: glycosyltransferase family 1 protein [Acidobacteriota bacterium]
MKVLIPLLSIKPQSTSSIVYVEGLLPPLVERLGGDCVVLSTPFLADRIGELGCDVVRQPTPNGRIARLLIARRAVPRVFADFGADRYLVPDGQLLPTGPRSPTVITLHHHLNFSQPEGEPLGRRLYWRFWLDDAIRRTAGRADVLIAPSHAFAEEFEELVPESRGRLRVVSHGVHPSFSPEAAPAPPEPTPSLLVIGNPSPYKNVVVACDAFARLASSIPHRLELVGLTEEDLDRLGQGRGWSDEARRRMAPLGGPPRQELPGLLRRADVLLHPSRVESFGLPVLEALACGTPVACSALPSLRELTDGAAALAPVNDAEALAAAVSELLAEAESDAATRRDRGLAIAAARSWAACAGAVADLLAES